MKRRVLTGIGVLLAAAIGVAAFIFTTLDNQTAANVGDVVAEFRASRQPDRPARPGLPKQGVYRYAVTGRETITRGLTIRRTLPAVVRSAVGDSHPLWQKAAAMGAQIDPANPLYVAAPQERRRTPRCLPPPRPRPSKPHLDFDLDGGQCRARPRPPRQRPRPASTSTSMRPSRLLAAPDLATVASPRHRSTSTSRPRLPPLARWTCPPRAEGREARLRLRPVRPRFPVVSPQSPARRARGRRAARSTSRT